MARRVLGALTQPRSPGVVIACCLILACEANAAPPAPPVTALAYRPDGQVLAVGLRGELAIVDAAGDVAGRSSLPGSVTALAWSKDGTMLVVASGTPAKAGEISVYRLPLRSPVATIAAHGDLIHALAFSPDGTSLASCSYDRLVKLWDPASGKLQRELKDHSDSVYGVAWKPDGKLLASVAADRTVKIWDPATGTRLYSLGDPTDWVYAVAWSPDGKRVAAAGVDKSIRLWDINEKEGKLVLSAFAHEKPVLKLAFTADGATLFSLGEDRVVKAWDAAKSTEKKVYPAQPESVLSFAVRPDGKQFALGRYDGALLLVDAESGKSTTVELAATPEPSGTDSPRTAPELKTESTIAGSLSRAGEVDHYRIALASCQEVGIEVVPANGSKIDPVLALEDSDGNVLIESNGLLGHTAKRDGTVILTVRDREFRGGREFKYRLRAGAIPIITSYFPLGAQRGRTATVAVRGVFICGDQDVQVKVPADAALGSRIDVPIGSRHGPVRNVPKLVVGEFPESAPGQALEVPGSGEGVIAAAGETQSWRFPAKKGQPLVVEVEARRIGSLLDPVIEILDAHDKPVERAVLRSVARTFVTFRDHDSAGAGIRMETWNEFAIDDYVLVGQELMRIKALPKNPDDDCQFYSVGGQRVGYLGTTPSYHALNTPMFRVSIHPPGTTFPPNGMPLITLGYRNDDGGPGYGKDSRLRFDPPADGEYRVRVNDARGQGGLNYGYRVTVRPPRPDFSVSFNPTAPSVWKGGALPITVTADRRDDFDGPIQVRLENLSPGFSAPPSFIEAGQTSTTFAIFAEPSAANPDAKHAPLNLVATAMIDGKEVRHEANGALPKAAEPGDIVTTVTQPVVTLKPGQETRMLVKVERRNGFKGRIPLDVLGLPHGVRVLHIGLNGILVTERDTEREVFLYAEPWVKPMEHPFVVLANREGKNTQHAAKSVLLKIEK
jgi:WD40 repeat protein